MTGAGAEDSRVLSTYTCQTHAEVFRSIQKFPPRYKIVVGSVAVILQRERTSFGGAKKLAQNPQSQCHLFESGQACLLRTWMAGRGILKLWVTGGTQLPREQPWHTEGPRVSRCLSLLWAFPVSSWANFLPVLRIAGSYISFLGWP
jgi:hypothetical protein